MLEVHDMSRIRFLLGLSQFEIEELKRNIHKRNDDVEYENRVLEEMQHKQLRALMCLDNSDLKKHSVPARLIMSRKSWTKCHRVIQKNSRMRYLLCQAGKLQNARRFLSRRGLPMTYAGEWDNQFVANASVSNHAGVPEAFEWRQITNPSTHSVAINRNNETELPEAEGQVDVQNAQSSTVNTSSARQDGHIPPLSSQPGSNNRRSQVELPRQCIVRLKIGAKNAARIQAAELLPHNRHRDVFNVMFTHSVPQPMVREPNSDDTIEQSPPKPHRLIPVQGNFPLPVRRKLGCWSADKHRPKPTLSPTAETPEGLDEDFYDLPPANQRAHKTRQVGDNINEQIHKKGDLGRVPVWDTKTPQSLGSFSSKATVSGNAGNLVSRNILEGIESYSSGHTKVTANKAQKSRIVSLKTRAGMVFETAGSSGRVVNNTQVQSANSANEYLSSLPDGESASKNMQSNSTTFSIPDYVTRQNPGHSQELMETANIIDVTASIAKEDSMPSTLAQDIPSEEPSQQESEASSPSVTQMYSFDGDELEVSITHNIPKDFGVYSMTHQRQAPMQDQDRTQEADTVQPCQTDPPEPREQQSTDDIHVAGEKEVTMVETLQDQIEDPSIPTHESSESDTNQAVAKELSNNHSTVPDNATVEMSLRSIKTRQTTNNKKAAGQKRNASTESLASQPNKRNKKSELPVTQRVLRTRPATKNEEKK
jgi:hypothetical protein